MSTNTDVKGAILEFLRQEAISITGNGSLNLNENSRLIGSQAVISSRELVELALAAEDHMDATYGAVFDWTSDSAMSSDRSIFRSVGTLLAHLVSLVEK